jgi:hypothetical protein
VPRTIEYEGGPIETLVKQGFELLDVTSDFKTLFDTLRCAKLVVSIEGSHINNYNYSAGSNCAVFVLQPSDRFTARHRHWAESVGVQFGFVVGTKRGANYAFSAAEILNTVDLALNEIS